MFWTRLMKKLHMSFRSMYILLLTWYTLLSRVSSKIYQKHRSPNSSVNIREATLIVWTRLLKQFHMSFRWMYILLLTLLSRVSSKFYQKHRSPKSSVNIREARLIANVWSNAVYVTISTRILTRPDTWDQTYAWTTEWTNISEEIIKNV